MRCSLLKVVGDGKTLAMWALIGESGSGRSVLGMPRPA
jgi:ABC-type dipeptide/oligopeptide/nickel transport system ATPase component